MFWNKKPGPETYLDAIDALKIKKPVTLEQLDAIYINTVKRAQTDMHWYQKRQRRWRLSSRLIRLVVFTMLLIGAVIPLVDPQNAQKGYIALVVAGLSFSLDKIFLVSQTWVRYMSAEMNIRTIILEFRYDFLITRAELIDTINEPQSREILSQFRRFLLSVHNVVKLETDTWTTQLDTALKMLGDTMKKQTEMVEKKFHSETEETLAKSKPGNRQKLDKSMSKILDSTVTQKS